MSLKQLEYLSNRYGANPAFVLAGGGNTSYKEGGLLYIKGSGTSLADIRADQFVAMERELLARMWEKEYPEENAAREKEVLADLMDARAKGQTARPSVETLLHDLLEYRFVLHVHPALINGVTCAQNGEETVKSLFPESVWVPSSKPGHVLALLCKRLTDAYRKERNASPKLLFLQNHGVFFAADTVQEIDASAAYVMHALQARIGRAPDVRELEADGDKVASIAPLIRMSYRAAAGTALACARFFRNAETDRICRDEDAFQNFLRCFTPDHIVYCKAKPLFIREDELDRIPALFLKFTKENGFAPKIAAVCGLGIFAVAETLKEVLTAREVFLDEIAVDVYTESFGGFLPMERELVDFIVHWEVESYRQKTSLCAAGAGRLAGKIALVTGSAQGFGEGIARELAREGANVVVADLNGEGAKKVAEELCRQYGPDRALAVRVNVADEESVRRMFERTAAFYGGLDLYVNNAGIVRAGSLEEMTKENFELVTSVNYTAYFLCVKYASRIMKLQHAADPEALADIVEINSKSGLEGSNKNFAYAGSKFGGIGLTQSFALELVPYRIKVNAVCPGNFLNGPLWMDPEKGLFVQYLRAGKVPGAQTVQDVKRFYEGKVPLNRGCEVIDVARAILYLVEQTYETGQALPVTGGQVMLK